MEKLHLLLLEDDVEEVEDIKFFLEENDYIVTHVKDTSEASQEIKNQVFDIIILDIMIDGKPDGIKFAQSLNELDYHVPFLFLTSMQSRTIFDTAKYTNPFTYLLKPYNELELLYTIELAIENYHQQSNSISVAATNAVLGPEFLFIKKNRKVVKVNVSTINYIEVDKKYCNLVCDEGNYLIKLSLSKIKEVLANPTFKQTHRNYLVNIKKIKELYFDDNLIILNSNHKIPFSERYKAAFLKDNLFFR